MNSERKEQIIKVAAKLFKEKGYNAVSMRDLAESLGIKAASIYNHIDSKEDILAEIIMDLAFDFTKHIKEVGEKEISIIARLKEIIRMHVATTFHKTDNLACMNKEWRNLGEKDQQVFVELRRKYEEQFLEMVQQGISEGSLENRNPEIMVFGILSTLRTLYHWYPHQPKIKEEELVLDLQKNLLFGIATTVSH